MKKTIFAVMLALVLTFTLCALPAFADTDEIVSETADVVATVSEGADDAVSAVEENIEDAVDSIAAVTEPAVGLGVDTVEENTDAVEETAALDSAIDAVDTDALMAEGANEVLDGSTLTATEETSWLNGTSGIIAIIVAAVILVAAVITVIVLAPKKGKQK